MCGVGFVAKTLFVGQSMHGLEIECLKGIGYIAMLVLLAMCFCVVFPLGYAQNASVDVVPASATIGINGVVVVNVAVSDIQTPSLFSYQLELRFDPAILEGVSAEIPEGHFMTPISPSKIFIVDSGTINNEAGSISFALTLLAPEAGKTGGGVLCTATFRGKAEGSSSLLLENVILVDEDAENFPDGSFILNDGTVEVEAAPVVHGDMNGDGKVDIQDLAVGGAALGSTPGHPRWNPVADIVKDNVVNIKDLVQIAVNFTG